MISIEKSEIRKFGFIAFVFFGCFFALGLWFKKPPAICFFGVLFLLGLGFVLIPERLRPVYAGWLKIAHFIGSIITMVILALAYYLVITPSGFLKRIFGGLPIPVKPDKSLSTYWVIRDEPAQHKDRFIKRY